MTKKPTTPSTKPSGGIHVDRKGVVRLSGGQRIEGIEVIGGVPEGGGKVAVNRTYPVITDEDGRVDGVDMTLAENRRRLDRQRAGITENDDKELKGRVSNQPQHRAFVFDRHEKQNGKRWKHGEKWDVPLDPTEVHDTPKFPLGSVMFIRGGKEPK